MNREFWLDGFNLFHHWEATRGLLRPDSGLDIVRAIERSTRILGRHLGRKCGQTVLFLDGGLSWQETRIGDLRVRHSGPGRKADDRMLSDLGDLGDLAKRIVAVSNDRELRNGLKAYGAACLGIGEFFDAIQGKRKSGGRRGGPDGIEMMRVKCRRLSAAEVDAWVDLFGGNVEV
ncbi:MAG: NYN domain-containing protein [Planctomycetota bacterium]|jgi:hypothetical protein|nr:NYN domain-containing protein [Planctomycetota bacterium]